jgi:two-component system KDP operon response regulator KdpE
VFASGDFVLNADTHEVHVGGELVPLTALEYRLLHLLVRHAGTTLSHRYLLEQVWGEQYRKETHYLKVFVQRLRHKLGDNPAAPRYILTERGAGYRFMLQR